MYQNRTPASRVRGSMNKGPPNAKAGSDAGSRNLQRKSQRFNKQESNKEKEKSKKAAKKSATEEENHSFGYEMGWLKEEHFNASDADGDGLLNKTEFNDFLHPADSTNPKLLRWLCQEEIRERDTDKDGKLSFKEFFHGLFDLVRTYDEEGYNSSHHSDNPTEAPAKKLFADLDKDGDGYLTDGELLPVIGKLHPSERYYAKQQADYIISQVEAQTILGHSCRDGKAAHNNGQPNCPALSGAVIQHFDLVDMSGNEFILVSAGYTGEMLANILGFRLARLRFCSFQHHTLAKHFWNNFQATAMSWLCCALEKADTDKDGRLNLTEMIESPYVFYNAIFNDEEDEFDYHDEFR
ncbi:EF-hand domain [Dillenia turbinata]|uniref:EF-hand domain n=1 Tax=Dillenia turbinata TaxID=194707 RepID=A0AAN8UT19_9MAGN